jgi:tetratricopeptide (TPR) repeat protein
MTSKRLWIAAALLASGAAGAVAWSAARRPDPQRLWVEAESAFLAGRWGESRNLMRRIGQLRSKSSCDRLLEAQLAASQGRTNEALEELEGVRKEDSATLFAQARLMAGRLERARHRLRPAEAHLRRALEAQPGLLEAHRELIYLYGIQLRRRELDAEFAALARLVRPTHHDLFTRALTHFSSWRPDIAEDLQACVDADPHDRASRLALADILIDQPGQGERVSRLLDAFPETDAQALALRVGLALHEGRTEAARRQLTEGPRNHPALARYRGQLAVLRNDLDEAVAQFRLALGTEPYDRISTFELGRALALRGDKAAAEPLLERARRLNALYNLVNRIRSADRENAAPDLLGLGDACEAAGLREEAHHWYALAVDRDPLDTRAQQALARLGASP